MDIPITTYCRKHQKEETVYINVVDSVPYPNVCEDGDGSPECMECLKLAVEKHLKLFGE